jgi:hypothetical protein
VRLTLNGCACFVFAAGFLAVGVALMVSGRQLAPGDNAAAKVFRTDRSCTAPLTVVTPPGECTVVAATVIIAGERVSNAFTRVRSHTPYVYLRFADGRTQSEDLDGGDGSFFAMDVRPGAPARAQFFRGVLVRVASGNVVAETFSAPDVSAQAVFEMPWVGAVLIVIAGLFAFGGIRSVRGAAGATPLR